MIRGVLNCYEDLKGYFDMIFEEEEEMETNDSQEFIEQILDEPIEENLDPPRGFEMNKA